MSDARAAVLARIRAALGPAPGRVEVRRDYAVGSSLGRDEILDRFVERVTDYRATVMTTAPERVAEAVGECLGAAASVVVPADLDPAWLPSGIAVIADDGLATDVLDRVDAVVTAAALGIAETGTIVLDGGRGQGRRAVSLVPDVHVCVITADQVVATVPQAVRQLDASRPQTWISGPSATSDIELDRVEGVHGPRTLTVVLVTDPGP